MVLKLTVSDGQGFRPPLFRGAQICAAAFHTAQGLPHPFGLANHSWGLVETALAKLLDRFDIARHGTTPSEDEFSELVAAYRHFIYAMAEFFEAVLDKVPSCFVAPGQKAPKVQGAIKLRRHVAIICNKLKHNQNRIVPVDASCPHWSVLGFAIMGFDKDGVLRPNPEIHTDRRSFSFATDIRLILANAYMIGVAVAELIAKYPRSADDIPLVAASTRMPELLARVVKLPCETFPWEGRKHMPAIRFDGSELDIKAHGGEVRLFVGDYRICVHITADGATRKYGIV